MNNKGSVTIFLTLVLGAILLLALSCIGVVEYRLAESKGAMAVRSSISGIRADYNSYIFENYHILLFDKNGNGRGEAYVEERLTRDIQHNLGDAYAVEELRVDDYELLLEDDCSAFKDQLVEHSGYCLAGQGVEHILESTGFQDGTVSDAIYEDMDAANHSDAIVEEADISQQTTEAQIEDPELAEAYETLAPLFDEEDPRDFTEDLTSEGILAIVAPEDMEINSSQVDLSSTPSVERWGYVLTDYSIDNDFDDIDILKKDIGKYDSWKEQLKSASAGLLYSSQVFNCATETVQEDTVFAFELEYIICGKKSDRENLKSTVNRLIGVRFPVNYSYLVSSSAKMGEIKKISIPIAIQTLVPEPIVRYLIAGCWAYVESIFDVRCLLQGDRQEFFKSSATWKTDLNNLEDSLNMDGEDSDTGLCYKDYLLILLALDMEDGYYRMLDIIELNTKQHYREFDMNNAAVGLTLDVTTSYGGRQFYYRENISY